MEEKISLLNEYGCPIKISGDKLLKSFLKP